jgi:hypothetical protein
MSEPSNHLKILSIAELRALPPPERLIDGILPVSSSAFLYGPSGVGKSFLALDLSLSVATGQPWYGRPVKQGSVLYVAMEGIWGFPRRLSAWERHHSRRADSNIYFTFGTVHLIHDVRQLVEVTGRLKPTLVVLDTLAQVAEGLDENSAKDMGQVTAALRAIREACQNSTVLVVHHTGHQQQGRMRGHSLLHASADWILAFRPQKRNEVLLSREKARDESTGEDFRLFMQTVGDSCVLTLANGLPNSLQLTADVVSPAGISPVAEAMLAAFPSRSTVLTTAKWRAAVGGAERTFHRRRRDLLKEGLVMCFTKRGLYQLTDIGARIRFELGPTPSDACRLEGSGEKSNDASREAA